MSILRVRHVTTYHYRRDVGFGEHRILFRPRDSYDQRLLLSELAISPQPSALHWIHDVFGNCVAIANFTATASELRFETNIALDHTPLLAPRFRTDDKARNWPFVYDDDDLPDLRVSMQRQFPDDAGEVELWARKFISLSGETDTANMLMVMTGAIHDDFAYARRTAPGIQPPQVTLATRSGSCRDFALLMMEACRALGLAARFVTGYIYVPSRDGQTTRGGGASHAWCQIYLPGAGWVEFDPTNGIVGNRDLIRVGVARDPAQAIPLWGTFIGDGNDALGMIVQVNVTTVEFHANLGHDRPEGTPMHIKAGYELSYDCPKPTPMLLVLNIHPSRRADLLTPQVLKFSPRIEARDYIDGFGNVCTRITAPAGRMTVSTEFEIYNSGQPDVIPHGATQHAIGDLPDDTLVYLLGSRYCETDRLSSIAWQLFAGTPSGWPRVQAILDFVHSHIAFNYQRADATRSAWGSYTERTGVCRDYAHLAIAFCRCMNIPARYCTGYLGDIGNTPVPGPMDFSAWFEVYLGGHWHTADARNNVPRIGRILMARGRDATDVALSTQFGPANLTGFAVVTDLV